jgi:lysophospholipase L1-like esterase
VSRGSWLSIATLLTVVFVLLLATEFALRYRAALRVRDMWRRSEGNHIGTLIHRASVDPKLIYELTPGAECTHRGYRIRINSSGFRDDEFPDTPPRGARRIVILGDSVAWGLGVSMEDAFPQVLQRLLAERAPRDEPSPLVYNLAVDGYSTEQELRLLETEAMDLGPEVVLICYVLNDPDTADGGLARHFVGAQRSELLYQVRKAAWRIRHLLSQDADSDPRWDYLHFVHHDRRELVQSQFERLGRIAESAQLNVTLALVPLFDWDEDGSSYAWSDLHESIEQCCSRNGIRFVDLRDAMTTRDPSDIAFDNLHPNRAGHGLIAETLAAYLAGLLWQPA